MGSLDYLFGWERGALYALYGRPLSETENIPWRANGSLLVSRWPFPVMFFQTSAREHQRPTTNLGPAQRRFRNQGP